MSYFFILFCLNLQLTSYNNSYKLQALYIHRLKMKDKKPDFEKYTDWLETKCKDILGTQFKDDEMKIAVNKTYYESVVNTIKLSFDKSDFWKQLTENIREYNDEYFKQTKYNLIVWSDEKKHEVLVKPFDSFFLKTYRKNILENKNYPGEPQGGWILPHNWYSGINDIIRTLFVVKYIDGVKFLIDKLKSQCDDQKIECIISFEAKEEGYYAVHLYIKQKCEIPKIKWDTEKIDIMIEIQITTQLQEVIRKLLHKYYEKRRGEITEKEIKWQWDYKSEEFSVNYLGHILHYVEGMIMEVRDRQEEKLVW